MGKKDNDAHAPTYPQLLPGPEMRYNWDLSSTLQNSQETLERIRQAGCDLGRALPEDLIPCQ